MTIHTGMTMPSLYVLYTMSYLKQLLKSKTPDSTEIEHHLFEYCNLSCSFCGQNHKSKTGMDSILDKADLTIEFMKQSDLRKHTINVMGGEVFNDLIPESTFDDYYEFYRKIYNFCYKEGLEFRINWVTNLIFRKNIELVDSLLDTIPEEHAMISTSYDFAGRGLDINKSQQFKHNLNRYKDRIGVVGFVLTRPSIRKLIEDKDKYFKEVLYPNYPLYFDWYVPENSADKMMPSEQEILDALLYVADHYPNISPVRELLNNDKNEMTCYSLNKTTILPDGKQVVCRYMDYDKDKFHNPVDYSSNENIIEAHLDRHNCFSCQWFNRCTFRCFVQADWKGQERLDKCFMKTFFEEKIK